LSALHTFFKETLLFSWWNNSVTNFEIRYGNYKFKQWFFETMIRTNTLLNLFQWMLKVHETLIAEMPRLFLSLCWNK
jgi:uncharacterized membrane protein YedE/YeeE